MLRKLLLSMLLIGFFASPAYAVVYWDDEQEVLTGNGAIGQSSFGAPTDGPPSVSNGHYIDTAVKFSGLASHRYNYPIICQSSVGQPCGGWTDRNFPETNEHYGRLYLRVSNNFQWGAPNGQSKIWGVRSNTGLTKMWFNFYFSLGMKVSAENTPVDGSTSNLPTGSANVGTMPRQQWVCFEWHFIMNNPAGTANGTLQTWMNGTQTALLNNVTWKGAGNTSIGWGQIRLYRQSGGPNDGDANTAHIWFDRIAVGTTRIGCIGSGGGGDTTPPATPSGWTLH